MTGSAIQLHYFPIRGLAEQMRLAMVQAGAEYEEIAVNYPEMKQDIKQFKFGQCPRIVDGDVDIVQSNAIMRYIGRKHNMYGDSLAVNALVDEVLDGIAALRGKYLTLVYTDNMEEEAKKTHWANHGDPASASGRNGGAHWKYLEAILSASGTGFVAGGALTVADIALADLTFNYLRTFPEELKATYPSIPQHHSMVFSLPAIQQYLSSGKPFDKVNNNGLG